MRIVLHILDASRCRWTQRVDGVWSGPVEATLDEAARQIGQAPVDVLVPSEHVLLTDVSVAARQHRRLMQALPFAVEDQLAGDVAQYHVALGQQLGDHRYGVAAIDHGIMRGWYEALHAAGIEVRSMVPTVLALPHENGTATLLVDGDQALLRVSHVRGYQLGIGEIDAYLELEADLGQLVLIDPEERCTVPPERPSRRVPLRDTVLQLLAASMPDKPVIDLMQGEYETRGQVARKALGVWRWVAIIGALWIVGEGVQRGLEINDQAQQVEALSSEAEELLRRAFPDIGRVVQPREQMKQRLDALQSAAGGGGFLYLLRAAGPALLRAGDLEVRSASYRSGALVLELRAPNLAAIERVRQELLGSLDVEIESAATLSDGADARLRLQGRAG